MKFFAAIFVLVAAFAAGAAEWQEIASIEAAAREHALAHSLKLGMRQRLEAGPLDARLRLVKCQRELVTGFAPGANAPPRLTVEVRCPGSGGWKVYVPVQVTAFDKAVVATRALERGHLLTAADIAVTDSDVSGLPAGYWRDASQVDGLRLDRPVVAGTVLTPGVVKIEPMVRQGEYVTAVARLNGIAVQTQAVALAAAGADQRVRLKNPSSGKEFEGIVRGKGLVEISVH